MAGNGARVSQATRCLDQRDKLGAAIAQRARNHRQIARCLDHRHQQHFGQDRGINQRGQIADPRRRAHAVDADRPALRVARQLRQCGAAGTVPVRRGHCIFEVDHGQPCPGSTRLGKAVGSRTGNKQQACTHEHNGFHDPFGVLCTGQN